MDSIGYLIPISLGLGLIALGAFLWSLGREQYADLEGAASRILVDEDAPALDERACRESADAPSAASRHDGRVPMS